MYSWPKLITVEHKIKVFLGMLIFSMISLLDAQ